MITGVETAGLILAAFPLVLKGLTSWTEGVDTFRRWRKARQEVKRYSIRLRCQQASYRNTLERLLDDIVPSSNDLALMLEDPGGKLWHKPDYEQALTARLGDSYDLFCTVLTESNDALAAIMEKFNISPSGEVSSNDVAFLSREFQGFKLTMKKGVIEEQLTSIDRHCDFLQRNVVQNMELEPSRRKRREKRIVVGIRLIRQHATRLYDVVIRSQHWRCACKARHITSLKLQHRSLDDQSPRFRLRIMLSVSRPEMAEERPRWQDVDVGIMESSSKTVENGLKSNPMSDYLTLQGLQSPQVGKVKTKKVSFVEHGSVPSNPGPAPKFSHPISALRLASDLCTEIHDALSHRNDSGFILDAKSVDNIPNRYVFSFSNANEAQMVYPKPLPAFFANHNHCQIGVSQGDRLALAVHLASSVLQLEGTPWLKQAWKTEHLDIYEYRVGRTCDQKIHQTVYLSWPLLENKEQTTAHEVEDVLHVKSVGKHRFRNESLVSLGCALVELSLAKSLGMLVIAEDEDVNETVTRFNTAQRMLDSVCLASGDTYASVVNRCLHCSFDTRDLSFENEDFQQTFFNAVVSPLEENLKWWRDWC